jgi:hypothetical protein
LRTEGLVGVVGEVVTMVGGIDGEEEENTPEAERDLVRGKKCFKRADTEYRGDKRVD